MPYVYILRCSDSTFYTGSTFNLEKRLAQHQLGDGANYTRKRLPVELAFLQQFDSVAEAFAAEKRIQNWSHGKKAALIAGDIALLRSLSQSRSAPAVRPQAGDL